MADITVSVFVDQKSIAVCTTVLFHIFPWPHDLFHWGQGKVISEVRQKLIFWTISPYQSSHHKFMWKLKNSGQNGQAKLSVYSKWEQACLFTLKFTMATNSGFLRAGIYYRWHLVNIFTYLLNKSFLFRKICWSCIQHVRNISILALLLGKNKTPLKTKEKNSSAER